MTESPPKRRRVGDYEILSELHSGGMGSVLLARKRGAHGFEKVVAIKTIRSDLQDRQELRTMFMDEARLVASLNHPAIAQVYDFGEDGELLYLVMEYVPGISFRQLLVDSGGPLPPGVALRAMAEVCRGLHAAHDLTDQDGRLLGVVHRDVSPHNLMVTFAGAVKIIDFGIARVRDREAPVTAVGVIKGKPGYMAPEQIQNRDVDRRTDVFLAGTVLHELLTGKQLFPSPSFAAFTYAVMQEAIAPPSASRPDLPPAVDETVMHALAREPGARYPTALVMAQALEAAATACGGATLAAFAEEDLVHHAAAYRARLRVLLDDEEIVETLSFRRSDGGTRVDDADPALATAALRDGAEGLVTHTPPTAVVGHWRRTSEPRAEPRPAARADSSSSKRRSLRPAWVLLGALILAIGVLAGLRVRALITRSPASGSMPTAPATAPGTVAPLPGPAAHPTPTPERDAARAVTPPPGPPAATPDKRPRKVKSPEPPSASPAAATPAVPARPAADSPQEFGQLTVGAEPYALVRIDNVEIGATPLIDYRIPVGRHRVDLLDPRTRGVLESRDVQVDPGGHETITLP